MRTAARGQQADDQALHDHRDDPLKTVGAIALNCLRLPVLFALAIRHLRKPIQHGLEQFFVALIRWPRLNYQRDATFVADQMAFAAIFPAIRGIRSGVRPPKTARTEALSTTTRVMSNALALAKSRNSLRCTWSQTPARVQSRNRRQQVVGLTPNSLGKSLQAQPLRSTYKMPSKQARSSQGGAPPFGDGRWTGNNGSTTFQSSSERSADMIGTPFPQSVNLHPSTNLRF
jgi:hypothetical protein